MASNKATTDDEAVVFGDEFLADEILARLPARCAARCTVLSKHFRRLVATSHFWLRQRRLGAPLEHPHAARLYRHGDCRAFEFHLVGPAFAMRHTVEVEQYSAGLYSSTCNGLVLVSGISYPDKGDSSVDGVVFNPATKEEARLSLPLPHPQNRVVQRSILGFGYGPSSKVYKALIREDDHTDDTTWLSVVTLNAGGSSDGHEPRKVLSYKDGFHRCHSLHTGDGKVYFLMYTIYFTCEEQGCDLDQWEVASVLAFDVDDEVVTSIPMPEGNKDMQSDMMLQIHGRPCVFEHKGLDTVVIWLLTPDHRWEQLYVLVKESSPPGDYIVGAWEDCQRGLLYALFSTTGAYLYNLHELAAVKEEEEEGSGNRLTALSSLAIDYEWPEPLRTNIWPRNPNNLLDYQPTLISPASIFSDAVLSGSHREISSVAPTNELDEMFLETTRKLIIDPAMQMRTNL